MFLLRQLLMNQGIQRKYEQLRLTANSNQHLTH